MPEVASASVEACRFSFWGGLIRSLPVPVNICKRKIDRTSALLSLLTFNRTLNNRRQMDKEQRARFDYLLSAIANNNTRMASRKKRDELVAIVKNPHAQRESQKCQAGRRGGFMRLAARTRSRPEVPSIRVPLRLKPRAATISSTI
jgi:hypothetical protein